MKLTARHWVMIIVGLLAFVWLASFFSGCPVPGNRKESKEIKELVKRIDALSAQVQQYKDSVTQRNNQLQDSVRQLLDERAELTAEINQLKGKASVYIGQIRTAKIAKDTPRIVQNCDSLVTHHEEYVEQSERRDSLATAAIEMQQEVIAGKDSIINRQTVLQAEIRSALGTTSNAYNELSTDYRKLTRRYKWGKIKEKGLAATTLILLGTLILKK